MPPKLREDGLFDRPFLYHIWDDPSFEGKPEFASVPIQTANFGRPGTSRMRFHSLKRDLAALRAIGAAKTITAGPGMAPQPLVDGSVDVLGFGSEHGPTDTLRELNAIKIGVGAAHKVLVTGCHHAREWISVELPYLTAEYLINNFTDTPTTPKQKRIKHLLANRQIWIVPMCNPDGHDYSVRTNRNWRVNRRVLHVERPLRIPEVRALYDSIPARTIEVEPGTYVGVDINRNYPTSSASTFPWGFETYSTTDPGSQDATSRKTSRDPRDGGNAISQQIFAGITANSESETQAIVRLIESEAFRGSISYHSYGGTLLYPDDAERPPRATSPNPFALDVVMGMAQVVASAGTGVRYQPMAGASLYPATGDLLDYAYDRLRSSGLGRPSCLPEVRPVDPASPHEIFSGLPASQIYDTWKENLGALLAFIHCCGFDQKAASTVVRVASDLHGSREVVQVVRNGWKVFEGWRP